MKANIELKQILVEIEGKLCAVAINDHMRRMIPGFLQDMSDGQIKVVDLSNHGLTMSNLEATNVDR